MARPLPYALIRCKDKSASLLSASLKLPESDSGEAGELWEDTVTNTAVDVGNERIGDLNNEYILTHDSKVDKCIVTDVTAVDAD